MENIYRLPYSVNSFNEHYNPSANMSHKQGFWNSNAPKTLGFGIPLRYNCTKLQQSDQNPQEHGK